MRRYRITSGPARTIAAAVATASGVAAVVGLAGCSPIQAGSAAVVGSTAITEKSLQGQVTAYLASLPKAERTAKASSIAQVQQAILGALVDEAVVAQVADARGVVVTPASVSTRVAADVAGAGPQLDTQLASLYLTRASLPAFERTNLQFIGLRESIGAASLDDTAAQAKVFTYLAQQARRLPVRLSPRYGTWNPSKLALTGGVQSISTPAA